MKTELVPLDQNAKYLVTGSAGFIGFHLSKKLLELGCNVIGLDNLNDYYDVSLKEKRLSILNCDKRFRFIKGDISDKALIDRLFIEFKPDYVINLAAQAGVRYSIKNPDVYISSNIIGFFNILEACRYHPVKHLIFASSSSVYGQNTKVPFSTSDMTDFPASLYAATKKSDELMAYAYSNLYKIPSTGIRFFTVYGPWGRPDMAYFSFTQKIVAGKPIQVFNNGKMKRDFTYIDDIVKGIVDLIPNKAVENEHGVPFKMYNIGNNHTETLSHFIDVLEEVIGKKAIIQYLPMQPGDVIQTYADVDDLIRHTGFKPNTSIKAGLTSFWDWYQKEYL